MSYALNLSPSSMAAYEAKGKMERREERLKKRREKLASLLAEEREMYQVFKN